jgi:hypothetical protein
MTPYNKGNKLPTKSDVQRIGTFTNRAFITSGLKDRSIRGNTGSINRTINEVANKIRVIDAEEGFIRMRRRVVDLESEWRVELFGAARELKTIYREQHNEEF